MKNTRDEKKRDEVLKKMLQTPHKPHVKKTLTKSAKKKDGGRPVKNSHRPQDS